MSGDDAAYARLIARMATARAEHATKWFFKRYVFPIGCAALATLAAGAMGTQDANPLIPIAPLVAGAVAARVLGGITAGRVASALVAPIVLWIGVVCYEAVAALWWLGSAASLTFLCFEPARLPPRSKGPTRRAANHFDGDRQERHTPTQ